MPWLGATWAGAASRRALRHLRCLLRRQLPRGSSRPVPSRRPVQRTAGSHVSVTGTAGLGGTAGCSTRRSRCPRRVKYRYTARTDHRARTRRPTGYVPSTAATLPGPLGASRSSHHLSQTRRRNTPQRSTAPTSPIRAVKLERRSRRRSSSGTDPRCHSSVTRRPSVQPPRAPLPEPPATVGQPDNVPPDGICPGPGRQPNLLAVATFCVTGHAGSATEVTLAPLLGQRQPIRELETVASPAVPWPAERPGARRTRVWRSRAGRCLIGHRPAFGRWPGGDRLLRTRHQPGGRNPLRPYSGSCPTSSAIRARTLSPAASRIALATVQWSSTSTTRRNWPSRTSRRCRIKISVGMLLRDQWPIRHRAAPGGRRYCRPSCTPGRQSGVHGHRASGTGASGARGSGSAGHRLPRPSTSWRASCSARWPRGSRPSSGSTANAPACSRICVTRER